MKAKHMVILPISAMILFVSLPEKADAQMAIAEVIKEGIKKVIRAIDLQVQRLQNQTIWLQDAQKTIENQLSKLKLKEISDWSEKQKTLYEKYYQELLAVKAVIAYYQRIRDMTETEAALLHNYERAWSLLKQDKHFSTGELQHMQAVYSGILKESVTNLDGIMVVVNAFRTQMSDEKRLELIDAAANRLEGNAADLRRFNTQNYTLSLQRAKDESELATLKQYYGIN